MKTVITDLFGDYEPVENQYIITEDRGFVVSDDLGFETVQVVQETIVYSEMIPDYAWFVGVAIFTVVLYSFLRMVGGLLKCKL